jgi:hypothetical protein
MEEFPEIKTREQFADLVKKIMKEPTEVKNLERGRTGYWHEESKTVVIRDSKSADGGTAFKPDTGRDYFNKELK